MRPGKKRHSQGQCPNQKQVRRARCDGAQDAGKRGREVSPEMKPTSDPGPELAEDRCHGRTLS